MKQEIKDEQEAKTRKLEISQLKKELKKAQRKLKRLENENNIFRQLNEKALQIREYIEEEQERKQQYINLILGSAPMIFLLVDQELKTLMAADSFYEKTSFTKEQIHKGVYICDLFGDLLGGKEKEAMADKIRESMAERRKYHYVERMGLTGNERIYDVEIKPAVSTKDELIGAVLIFSNITELVHAREAAESADRAKGNFLANMSHEIRTPMNAITGMSEFIIRDTVDDAARENAQQIKNAASSLLAIINDILDFSKIEAGRMELVKAPYELRSLLNDVAVMIQVRLGDKPVELKLEVDPELPSKLVGDELRIRQILINMLNNAVKFTDQGSIILRMWLEPGNRNQVRLFFQVEDSGRGIRPENIKKIFCSFSQVDTKRNRKLEGTGLGLAISRQLVEAMEGQIDVKSEYGRGTVFTWYIQNEIEDPAPVGEIGKSLHGGRQEVFKNSFLAPDASVLVVDDNQVNLKVAEGILKPYQMNVTLAESGQEAIRLARAGQYDIIFMDHMMPEMDGVETLKEIRKIPGQEHSVIIALTANAMSGVKKMYLSEGFQDFLAKPVEMSKMEEILKKYLPQGRKKKCGRTAVSMEEIRKSPAVLRQVYLEGKKKLALLSRLEKEEKILEYQIEVHALKSVAGAIGERKLSQMAKEQELAAKEGNTAYIHAHFKELQNTYRKLIERLALQFPPEPLQTDSEGKEEISLSQWKDSLKKLSEAAQAFDLDVMEEISGELQKYRLMDWQRTALHEFCNAAQMFDYAAAQEVLKRVSDCLDEKERDERKDEIN